MKKVNNGIKSTILCLISLMNIKNQQIIDMIPCYQYPNYPQKRNATHKEQRRTRDTIPSDVDTNI